MNKIAIELVDINKSYEVHHEKPTLVEKFVKGKNETFVALRNINIVINRGEKVGIIGPNGSGKTTLLKIISGITNPTKGSVKTNGMIISLIDLQSGFHPDLTGYQNIYINGMLLGLNRNQIKKRINSIIRFADIRQFIDAPLFTYSSGMVLRLGFAIAVHAKPSVIIIDENITVGDAQFRKKIWKWIDGFIKKGNTLILASHEMSIINALCTRIIKLDKGSIVGSKTRH